MSLLRRLLWVDCTAGAFAGVLVLLLSGPLSRLEGLPRSVLLFTGVVNVLYAAFSFSLAVRATWPVPLITVLVVANGTWVPVCLGLAATHSGPATVFGFAHLVGEAAFVGGLALPEWRHRHLLFRDGSAVPDAS